MPPAKWTDEEYDVTIDAYCTLWRDQQNGNPVDVARKAEECSVLLQGSRTPATIRMRFQNISYVFSLHDIAIVEKLEPLKKITDECVEYIWERIKENLGITD